MVIDHHQKLNSHSGAAATVPLWTCTCGTTCQTCPAPLYDTLFIIFLTQTHDVFKRCHSDIDTLMQRLASRLFNIGPQIK